MAVTAILLSVIAAKTLTVNQQTVNNCICRPGCFHYDQRHGNIKLEERPDGLWLEIHLALVFESRRKRSVVTTELLGRAMISDAPYVKPDGTSYRLDSDYFGNGRNMEDPAPGPFRFSNGVGIRVKVWPKKQLKVDRETD